MAPVRALAALAALLVLAGCSVAAEPIQVPAAASALVQCTETPASPAGSRPAALAGTTASWFGRDDLWVVLPDYPPSAEGDVLQLKLPWVTLAGGQPTDALGSPSVTATRTDAPGEAVGEAGTFTRSFGNRELPFWTSSVAFPEPGCWTVRGSLGATTIEFTVDVVPSR